MKRKMAEDKLETLKKTPLGARAFADVTAAVSIVVMVTVISLVGCVGYEGFRC